MLAAITRVQIAVRNYYFRPGLTPGRRFAPWLGDYQHFILNGVPIDIFVFHKNTPCFYRLQILEQLSYCNELFWPQFCYGLARARFKSRLGQKKALCKPNMQ